MTGAWGAAPELPPHDEYLERGVLGAILCQPDREHSAALLDDLTGFLDVGDFFRDRHRLVYAVAVAAFKQEGQALLGDVLRRLRLRRRLEAVGGAAELAGLAADASAALIVREEALYLADLGLQRLLMEARGRVAAPAAGSPEAAAGALEALNGRVQDKRARLEAARGTTRGRPGVVDFDPLAAGLR